MSVPDDLDVQEYSRAATSSVKLFLAGDDDEPAGGFAVQRYGRSEARAVAKAADTLDQAATDLEAWFTDRLTVDPGIPGPFGNLAYDLITSSLDFVDWEEVAAEIRD